MVRNFFALIFTFAMSLLWLRANDFAAHRGWMSVHLSRKIIHMGTGPIFVVCWLLFENTYYSRYLVALVPLLITLQFFFVGMGWMRDETAVQAMSRTGDRREILRGPLYYGIVFVVLTIAFWYDTPIGIVALMMMCGGDGLAEIAGRRLGKRHLPWNTAKTWIGSLGMFLGGWIFASSIMLIFTQAQIFPGTISNYIAGITLISFAATLVESIPLKDVDNITVAMTAVLLGFMIF